jgi:hypothetical protein
VEDFDEAADTFRALRSEVGETMIKVAIAREEKPRSDVINCEGALAASECHCSR